MLLFSRNLQLRSWHQSVEFQAMALAFHDACGRTPPLDTLEPAKAHFAMLGDQLLQVLRSKNVAVRRENQGSSYEGIKTRSSSLEFDCMVVLCGGDSLTINNAGCPRGFTKLQVTNAVTTPASSNRLKVAGSGSGYLTRNGAACQMGFSKLQTRYALAAPYQVHRRKIVGSSGCSLTMNDALSRNALTTTDWLNRLTVVGSNEVDPRKVVDWFQGQLQMALNMLSSSADWYQKLFQLAQNWPGKPQMAFNRLVNIAVQLRRHGDTAVQMDVYNLGDLWYSVDMVPGFVVNEYSFVAKSKKVPFTWRQSFAQVEKAKWGNIDRNNQCHKMVARMVKVIREIDDPMKPLQSYTIKTALMNLDRDQLTWRRNDLGKRFVDVLAYLRDCMTSGMMPHHYIGDDLNILEGYFSNPHHLANMKNRLDHWLNSEPAMRELLNNRVPDVTYRASPVLMLSRQGTFTEVFPEDI